jgi:RNA recognition motif-containing protein
METKLYVGNLSYSTSEETLRLLFSEYGSVTSVELIKDHDTGNSKGFAFVEMGSQDDSDKAISSLNGASLENRVIKVSIAKPREERPQGGWYADSPSRSYGSHNSSGQKRAGSTRRY